MHFRRSAILICVTSITGALLTSGHAPVTSAVPRTVAGVSSLSDTSAEELKRALEEAPTSLKDSSVRATAGKARDLRTPFEISNGAAWTSVAEARRFNQRLDESSPRVKVERIGTSGAKQPIQMLSVGYPEPKPVSEAAKGSVILFNCSIHGDEPSGREGCMQLARDMSTTTNPSWIRLLKETTVLFTTINPDGWQADTRGNAAGVDINRDFLALATPEARALAKVMRDWKPDVLNDLHEFGPREFYDAQVLALWPRNRNVDPQIHALSKTMVNDYSLAQVASDGYTTSIYGQLVKDGVPFQQIAGDGQGRILRNYAGLQHITGQLTETAADAVTPEEESDVTLLNRRRVVGQYDSAVGSVSMLIENRQTLAQASVDAASKAAQAGAERSGVVYFDGQDDMVPTTPEGAEPHPMCGYQLSATQLTELRPVLELHGITWKRNRDGAIVTMAQPAKTLIPLIFDARAPFNVSEAAPLDTCP